MDKPCAHCPHNERSNMIVIPARHAGNTVKKECRLPCERYNAYIDSMANSFSKFMEVLTEGENGIHT